MQALIPVKKFAAAKQRLGSVLSVDERAGLSNAMLGDVFAALASSIFINSLIVCTDEPAAQNLARALGVRIMDKALLGCTGLNDVVNAATRVIAAEGCRELMVVHADLPLLDTRELAELVLSHRRAAAPAVSMVPDRTENGTNLLVCNPALPWRFQYGHESFDKHCRQAQAFGMSVNVCRLPGASLDIDRPEDLQEFAARPKGASATSAGAITFAFLAGRGAGGERRMALK